MVKMQIDKEEEVKQMWNRIEEYGEPGGLTMRSGNYPIGYKNINPNCPYGYFFSAITIKPTDEPQFKKLGWKFGESIFFKGKNLEEIKEKIINHVYKK